MKISQLDLILVTLGLLAHAAYHSWLFLRVIHQRTKTVIGINAMNRRIWVHTIMEDSAKNSILGVQTLRNNIMASTLLASTAIMLASLIAVLMTSGGNASHQIREESIIIGDKSDLGLSIKFFVILVCFLLAFLLNVQSVRYYSHTGILITVPKTKSPPRLGPEYMARALNKGSYFWSLGLHAFYISIPLFLWVFGPISMFICSIVLVCLLYFLDVYSGHSVADDEKGEKNGSGDLEIVFGSVSMDKTGSSQRFTKIW